MFVLHILTFKWVHILKNAIHNPNVSIICNANSLIMVVNMPLRGTAELVDHFL